MSGLCDFSYGLNVLSDAPILFCRDWNSPSPTRNARFVSVVSSWPTLGVVANIGNLPFGQVCMLSSDLNVKSDITPKSARLSLRGSLCIAYSIERREIARHWPRCFPGLHSLGPSAPRRAFDQNSSLGFWLQQQT